MSRPGPVESSYSYPPEWPAIADQVRERAGGRCECRGECANPYCTIVQSPGGRCIMQERRNWPPLQVVALDRNPCNVGRLDDRLNLRAFCLGCADAFRWQLHRRPGKDPAPVPARRQTAQATLDL